MTTLTETEWDKRFTQITPTEGVVDDPAGLPDIVRQCWTLVEANGHEYMIPGIHIVNKIGYLATEELWIDDDLLHEWRLT